MSDPKKYQNEEWLRERYWGNQESGSEIAEKCQCNPSTVRYWLNKHNIETRGCGGSIENRVPDRRLKNADWLRQQYVVKGRSGREIAEDCDCSSHAIYDWIDRHGIDKRPEGTNSERRAPDQRLTNCEWLHEQYIVERRSAKEIAAKCDCSEKTVYDWLGRHDIKKGGSQLPPDQRLTDEGWLRQEYLQKSQHFHEIAAKLECSETAVREWAKRHGIETRGAADFKGEDHPRWNGGPADYGAGWNRSKRQSVRQRDDHTCQDPRCSLTQKNHLDEYDEKLHVHHLQKARDVDDPERRNAKENLITLCRDCHKRWEKIADAGLVPQMEVADD